MTIENTQQVLAYTPFKSIVVWYTFFGGRPFRLHQLPKDSLISLVTYLDRRKYRLAAEITNAVLQEIYYDIEQYDFLDLCREYNRKPETWRMKIDFNLHEPN